MKEKTQLRMALHLTLSSLKPKPNNHCQEMCVKACACVCTHECTYACVSVFLMWRPFPATDLKKSMVVQKDTIESTVGNNTKVPET